MNVDKIKKVTRDILASKEVYNFINDLIRNKGWDLLGVEAQGQKVWAVGFKSKDKKNLSINFKLNELWDGKGQPKKFENFAELTKLIKNKDYHVTY